MNISVLGCGRWGAFLAWYFNKIGHEVLLWGRPSSERFKRLEVDGKNDYVELSRFIRLETSLKQALSFSKDIVIAIDEQNLRQLMENTGVETYNVERFIFKAINPELLRRTN